MNVIEGLKANYSGKVLARALRAVREQKREGEAYWGTDADITWSETKEGWKYWSAVYYNKPNPDQYLPNNYVDVDEKISNEAQSQPSCLGAVMCSVCEGTGILTEPDCCWNVDYIQKYGSCCGNPNPIQVQCKYCHGEGFFKHCT